MLCCAEEVRMKKVVPLIDVIALQQEIIASKCQHWGSGILIYFNLS